jgi:hypothetical protein
MQGPQIFFHNLVAQPYTMVINLQLKFKVSRKAKKNNQQKKEISQLRSNVCRLVFFSNAPASAAAPAAPTELSDDGGGSAATQTTHRNAPPYHNIIPRHNNPSTTPSKTAQSLKYNRKKGNLTVKIQRLQAGVLLQRSRQRSSSRSAHGVVH